MSDLATKGYVDNRLAQRGPFFPRIAWIFECGDFSTGLLRNRYAALRALGINSVLTQYDFVDWQSGQYAKYDRVYNAAAEYGMKVYWYTGIYRLGWTNPATGQKFLERYKNHPACGGWEWGDEPNYENWGHNDCRDAHNLMNSQDPYHPNFAVFGYDLSKNYDTSFNPGCELYDVGCCDIHAIDLWGDIWQTNLHWWLAYTDHYPSETNRVDGWLDCNKGMLPCIQAYVGAKPEDPGYGMTPDMMGQFNIWKQYYPFRSQMKGIGFWHWGLFMGGGSQQAAIREGIKQISRATGWIE